jgi:uncharacterized protein with FMN-binding domain
MFPKRGAIALVVTALALILLLSFKTPDNTPAVGSVATAPRVEASPVAGAASSPPSSTEAPAATTDGSAAAQTITGTLVQTRYGDVEVQISVASGTVTDVEAVALPTGGRSGQISRYVAPILSEEALQAQSSAIDLISGATYTSTAYARSLQSALDQAGIAEVQTAG